MVIGMNEAKIHQSNSYELILECYRSGQMSARQWDNHLNDEVFRMWLETRSADLVKATRTNA